MNFSRNVDVASLVDVVAVAVSVSAFELVSAAIARIY